MGLFEVTVRVSNPTRPVFHEAVMPVDTGATYSVLPSSFLARLGITPDSEDEFTLADNKPKRYRIGEARFGVGERERTSPVIFGDEGTWLLGATSLQALGLVPDTTNHQLIESPKLLVGVRGFPFGPLA